MSTISTVLPEYSSILHQCRCEHCKEVGQLNIGPIITQLLSTNYLKMIS